MQAVTGRLDRSGIVRVHEGNGVLSSKVLDRAKGIGFIVRLFRTHELKVRSEVEHDEAHGLSSNAWSSLLDVHIGVVTCTKIPKLLDLSTESSGYLSNISSLSLDTSRAMSIIRLVSAMVFQSQGLGDQIAPRPLI